MTTNAEKVLIGTWLSGERLEDLKMVRKEDFTEYGNLVQTIKKMGGGDMVDISEKSGTPMEVLNECVKNASPLAYEQVMARVLTKRSQEWLKENQNRTPREIVAGMNRFITASGNLKKPSTAVDLYLNYVAELDKRHSQELVTTGLHGLDRMLYGVKKTNLSIVAARPSVGKSALMLQIALNIAKQGKKVLFFPLEMSEDQMTERIVCRLTSNIQTEHLKTGNLTREEWDEMSYISERMSEMTKMGTFLLCEGENYLENIHLMIRKHRPYAIFIDQLEQLNASRNFKDKRERFSHMTNNLKRIALDEDVSVWLACQINRNASNMIPTLADLKESGSIEEDSDEVILLHRENEERMEDETIRIELAKNRQGETGYFDTLYRGKKYTFYNFEMSKDS